jgi:hypothetical protein
MAEVKHTANIGAPDPELNTSPIAEDNNEETEVLRQEVPGEPVCYFNDRKFENDDFVKSGSSVYKCNYGIWIPAGPADPDNP